MPLSVRRRSFRSIMLETVELLQKDKFYKKNRGKKRIGLWYGRHGPLIAVFWASGQGTGICLYLLRTNQLNESQLTIPQQKRRVSQKKSSAAQNISAQTGYERNSSL